MARLEDKIAEIKDPALRQIIDEEVKALKEHKIFGLVFEPHQPEVVPLSNAKVTARETVAKRDKLTETFRVERVRDGLAELVSHSDDSRETLPVESLVVVRRMGDPIYPALTPVDGIKNTDSQTPHHILIEADNYHALQLLSYLYAGKVDCIYIDPPYNTGARDWKYNNDYVDKNDGWRHSKWLSMMKKRMELAKRLLAPDGVLIVTIDDWEVNTLGLLIDELFEGYGIATVTIKYNPSGTTKNGFFRVHEYAYFVMKVGREIEYRNAKSDVRIRNLRRNGNNSGRQNRKTMFFPIYVAKDTLEILAVGDIPPADFHPKSQTIDRGDRWELWPLDDKDNEKCWYYSAERVKYKGYEELFFRWVKDHLHPYFRTDNKSKSRYTTMWEGREYDAAAHGSNLVRNVVGHDGFPFPKSIYAVRECLCAVVQAKKEALVVDFFAGSGTTLNAVNLLNMADGGQRQCILVTNNEVSEAEANELKTRGLRPGDDDYEAMGICRSVTWPRSKFTIQGFRDDGTTLPGEYLTGRTKLKEKRRIIQQLGFSEGRNLSLVQRKQLVSLISAVPQSKLEDNAPWFLADDCPVSILWDVQHAEKWLDALEEADHLTSVYIVTAENKLFKTLKEQVEDTLGPLLVEEEEKRPLSAGFPANLDYFKLDFLQPTEVQMGRQFAAILPILWMMAGAKGKRPEPPAPSAPWLIPPDCPFAVLMHEKRFCEFMTKIDGRTDLTHIFLVTNSDSAFHDMHGELPESIQAVQLYKSYLNNFKINVPRQ